MERSYVSVERIQTEYDNYRIPVLVATEKGALVAAYECRKWASDWAEIDLKVIYSEDGGDSFREVLRIRGEGNTVNNPVLIAEGTRVHLLYCVNYRRVFYRRSTDGGRSFSSPREITAAFDKYPHTVVATGPAHGVARDGTLLTPAWLALNEKDEKAHHPSFLTILFSPDGGETWEVGDRIGDGVFLDASEAVAAVTGAGEYLLSIRNETGGGAHNFRGFAKSGDGKTDWREVGFKTAMPDVICQGSMIADGGWLYHTNCTGEGRTSLTLKRSRDEFLTHESLLVDAVGGYSDLAIMGDWVYILYEQNPHEGGLWLARIPLTEFDQA